MRDILQDHLGRLWIATADDVKCFDGNRYYSLHDLGFPSIQPLQLAEAGDGAIWIASGVGLQRFYAGRLERIVEGFGSAVATISPDLVIASIGRGTGVPLNPDLLRIQRIENRWRVERIAELTLRGRFTRDQNGTFLYLCPGGWCESQVADFERWQPGQQLHAVAHKFDIRLTGWSATVLRDRFGCIWISSDTNSAFQCPGDKQPRQLPLNENALIVREAADGPNFLLTAGSPTHGWPSNFRVLNAKQGFPFAGYPLSAQDGTVWLASAGLFRWPFPMRLEFWTKQEGIDNRIWSLAHINGAVFAGSGRRILKLTADRTKWAPFADPKLGIIQNVMQGPNGTIWAAIRQYGVVQISSTGKLLAKSTPAGVLGMMLAQTPGRQVWLAGSGVMRVIHDGKQLRTEEEQLPGAPARALDMEVDRTGKLWACDDGGLISRESFGWRRLTTQNGLLENGCRSLAVTSSGDVWYGYYGTGAFSLIRFPPFSPPRLTHFHAGGDVGNADVMFFDTDRRSWLWRGTPDGVYVAAPEEAESGRWIRLGLSDGLPSPDANQQAFLDDLDGSVWFAVSENVVHWMPPADLVRPKRAPQVFVSGFSWNGESPRLVDAISTLPRDTDVIAHLGSLQFDRRSALRFRYRLQPAQKSWQETRSFDVRLGHLPWGDNTLEVQARLASGPWSAVASKSFAVTPPVWGTWPFWVFAAGTLLTLFAAAVGWRKRMDAQMIPALPDLKPYRDTALEPQARELVDQTLDGRYRVAHVIAKGGFAAIAKGWDLDRERECAIKIFRQDLPGAEKIGDWFSREVTALERVRHPNIVEVYGHGATPSGSPYLVMELIEGRTLREAIPSGGLSLRRISALLRQLGSALGALHAEGIYHRDLKPENIMLRSNGAGEGELVLIDFSIAIIKDPNTTLHILTQPEGTSNYMTPEHARGFANAATDIHGLALVFMEMLSGQSINELLPNAGIDYSTPARHFLRERQVPLSDGSLDLLCAALEFHPRDRPSDVVVFASRIATDLETGAIAPQP